MELMPHQKKAAQDLDNGRILYGGMGSGKSRAVLHYYVERESPRDIIVITTAKKRNELDWLVEAARFGIAETRETSCHGSITVDSWNNIGNYTETTDAFFIFDEQRLVGSGSWVKAFQKIAKKNRWVLLSGTPGDTWMDYAPVFIANGFYKHITDFKLKHVLYEPYTKFPKVKGYLNEYKLEKLRNEILVEMPFVRTTIPHVNWLDLEFDIDAVRNVYKSRWNPWTEEPCKDISEVFRVMRRMVNSDPSRVEMVKKLLSSHDRLIVFYNFDYELDLLRNLAGFVSTYEYNGHVKDPVPEGDRWVYLVQYVAGAEAWNCVTTNAMCFYSMTYSYKNFEQSKGRIDRLDTKYVDLFYYVFMSNSVIDVNIKRSLDRKESFNERKFLRTMGIFDGFEDPF